MATVAHNLKSLAEAADDEATSQVGNSAWPYNTYAVMFHILVHTHVVFHVLVHTHVVFHYLCTHVVFHSTINH